MKEKIQVEESEKEEEEESAALNSQCRVQPTLSPGTLSLHNLNLSSLISMCHHIHLR